MSDDAAIGSKRSRDQEDDPDVKSRPRVDAPDASSLSVGEENAVERRLLDLRRVVGHHDTPESVEEKHKVLDLSRLSKHAVSSESDANSQSDTKRSNLLDFLIIGVQKAGTMAAVKNLNKHPEIFVCREPHFFDLYWDMGLDWYKNKLRSNKKFIGEKTPELIYVDTCALRMKQVCPDARFILMLRDPVKRAYSSWNMQTGRNMEELSFGECVDRELNTMMGEKRVFGTAEYHYIQKGFYMDQIERFLRIFPDR
jgi:hypothetical protein